MDKKNLMVSASVITGWVCLQEHKNPTFLILSTLNALCNIIFKNTLRGRWILLSTKLMRELKLREGNWPKFTHLIGSGAKVQTQG